MIQWELVPHLCGMKTSPEVCIKPHCAKEVGKIKVVEDNN